MIANAARSLSLASALAMGAETWDGLMRRAGARSPFLSWAWHDAWLSMAPPNVLEQATVVELNDAAGERLALVPLSVRPVSFSRLTIPALSWTIDDAGCPDYLDTALGGADPAAAIGVAERQPWDIVLLPGIVPGETSAGALFDALAGRGYKTVRRPQGSCPYLDLPADWDTLLGSLPASRRQTLRRKERNLRKQHDVVNRDYGVADVNQGLELLFALHGRRWRGGDVFSGARMVGLHRRFAAWMAEHGHLWLTVMELDGQPAAAWYGFDWGDTVYFYQSGREPEFEADSVGRLLMADMIRRAIERGFRRMDFMRGEEDYKAQWTATAHQCEEWVAFRPGARGIALRGLDWMAHRVHHS